MFISSPLTGSQDVTRLKVLQTKQLIRDWQQNFQIDIVEEFLEEEDIFLYQCNETKLKFFVPDCLVGSENIYSKLENFDWYYMPRKWEHDIAVRDLLGCHKVLEIGCGKGAFVERIHNELKLEVQGIELNSNAVEYARNKKLPVTQVDLADLVKEKEGYFDAVCTFQVLEHVSDPRQFLQSLIQLVKPNGKLIISVPNAESFPKYSKSNLLDQPPHHMTQWCKETFNSLTTIFPIQVKDFRIEPLAEYHIDWYLSIQLSRLSREWLFQKLVTRTAHRVLKPILQKSTFVRKSIPGHTLYVCFEKIG